MAENKLEGFEDFDNLLGESEQGSEGGEFSNELDDLLGGEGGTEEAEAEGGGGGGGDSELDSFFEDLSTIDDLEVLQDEEDEAPAPEEPAAPAAAAPAPEPRRQERAAPKRERAPREPRQRGFFGRLVRWLVLLAILAGAGYAVYWFFFPSFEVPWPVQEPPPKVVQPAPLPEPEPEPEPELEPEPKMMRPAPAPAPAPRPKPRPKPAAKPAPQRGPWHVQVATCFFDSCVNEFRSYLQARGHRVTLRTRTAQTEALEIYASAPFVDRQTAEAMADRINKENPLEGHAYAYQSGGRWWISMGAFPDLARANVVRDSLNQQFVGDVMFATRMKSFPYKLHSVLVGGYASRSRAEAELKALKALDQRFGDAFVTRK